mmetsp:Transcript_18046/g.22728  ORF Transcript_18046/g.22728 Transcript_18046/m.22728 type:complete len:107 (+) Transcript_18046:98-418(+)
MRSKETKLLLEHIQTCPSNQGLQKHTYAPCPMKLTKCQGCQDARKLLSHYRQCRAEKRKNKKQQQQQQLSESRLTTMVKKQQQQQQNQQQHPTSTFTIAIVLQIQS